MPSPVTQSATGAPGWSAAAILIAALAGIPIAAVLWALTATTNADAWLISLPAYALNTALLMALVGALSGAIGVGAAWIVTAMAFPGRRLLSWLLVLPLAAPAYIIAYLYTDLLSFSGPAQSTLRAVFGWGAGDYWFPQIRSLPGAALMLSLVLYPYVYLLARAAFAAQSRSQFQAARTLGMSPSRAFFAVVMPGARPAIAGGLALVLMETLADFGVADYFAIPTFSTGIFRTWLAMGDRLAAMKLAGIMVLFVILLVGVEALSRRGSVTSNDRLSAAPPPFTLSPAMAALAAAACAAPVLLGFAIPVAGLVVFAATEGDGLSLGVLLGYARNSVVAGIAAAAIATSLALLLAYAQRQASSSNVSGMLIKTGVRISTLGYALPGALLAVGLLGPFASVDRSVTRFSRAVFDLDHGLLLTGSIALLVYALVIRFLTVSYNSVSGEMAKIS
ncbi:MAG: ABC transporter permease subunit, partial [Pseudomonadota bacterium]